MQARATLSLSTIVLSVWYRFGRKLGECDSRKQCIICQARLDSAVQNLTVCSTFYAEQPRLPAHG